MFIEPLQLHIQIGYNLKDIFQTILTKYNEDNKGLTGEERVKKALNLSVEEVETLLYEKADYKTLVKLSISESYLREALGFLYRYSYNEVVDSSVAFKTDYLLNYHQMLEGVRLEDKICIEVCPNLKKLLITGLNEFKGLGIWDASQQFNRAFYFNFKYIVNILIKNGEKNDLNEELC